MNYRIMFTLALAMLMMACSRDSDGDVTLCRVMGKGHRNSASAG